MDNRTTEAEVTPAKRSRSWWPFAALGCLALPILLVGVCAAAVYGLSATVWDDGGEPPIIREVEPEGVVRVRQATENWYGTDDGYTESFMLFYESAKPFAQIQDEYTAAMADRGYVADVRDWADGSGRQIEFRKEGEDIDWCFRVGTYPFGILTQGPARPYREKDDFAYIVQYTVRHGSFRTTASC